MIDPKLNDWWSAKRRTELSVVGSELRGAGVSLRVLLAALPLNNMIWYSLIHGDHADNVLLLGVEKKTSDSFQNNPHPAKWPGPMQAACHGRGDFAEYVLSSEIQSALGVTVDENDFQTGDRDFVRRQVYIHDDCFFAIEPLGANELRELVNGILEQHSFYLGAEVNWNGILDETTSLLRSVGEIRIQSQPAQQRLTLSWTEESPHS